MKYRKVCKILSFKFTTFVYFCNLYILIITNHLVNDFCSKVVTISARSTKMLQTLKNFILTVLYSILQAFGIIFLFSGLYYKFVYKENCPLIVLTYFLMHHHVLFCLALTNAVKTRHYMYQANILANI